MSPRRDRWIDESALQRVLRDLLCLAVVGDHVRWVVTDDDDLVDWLSGAGRRWREWAETLATRLAEDGVPPDGRVRSLARDIVANWVPDGWLTSEVARRLIAQRLGRVAQETRYQHSQSEGSDAELLGSVATGLEAQVSARRDARRATTTAG